MAFSLGEYQDVFLEEATDQLQELNQNLLILEGKPDDEDAINNIFRAAHSLKSSAAFVGLTDLSELAHKMENLLQGIRDKTMDVTPTVVDLLFKCFDVINSVIDDVSEGEEPKQELSGIIAKIQQAGDQAKVGGDKGPATSTPVAKVAEKISDIPKTTFNPDERKRLKEAIDKDLNCFEMTVYIDPTAQMKWVKAHLVIASFEKNGMLIKSIPYKEAMNDSQMPDVFKVIAAIPGETVDAYKACDVDQIVNIEIRRLTIEVQNGKQILKISEKENVNLNSKPAAEIAPVLEDVVEEVVVAQEEDVQHESDSDDTEGRADVEKKESGRNAPVLKTVKVSVDKLDQLLNNVAELVIANSGFYKLYEEIRDEYSNKTIVNEFKNRIEQMSRIAKDLQDGIMKTRMVPIGQVFSRFNRLVRDLTKENNKKVQLVIKGEETELDKKVIDAIGEPLMHLMRNAIDHGVEDPKDRIKSGKTEIAMVTLSAYQGGNQIFVEVSDDGRGLNLRKIKQKAIEKGLVTQEGLANMDDDDIYSFIFAPGFSTADKITDISGRGVGMNVVKEIVTELNGNVTIETEEGMGTSFVMSFPLTMAIMPAIMVKVGGEMYAIPLSDVIDTIKIAPDDISTIEGHEVINLRGEILSLLRLNEFVTNKSVLGANSKMPVVVVGYGNRKIGLIVDYLEGKQEIVIKSLEQNYRTVVGLAGASILGDGSICLILDISSMINRVIADQEKMALYGRAMNKNDDISDSFSIKSNTNNVKISSSSVVTESKSASAPASKPAVGKPSPATTVKQVDKEEQKKEEPLVVKSSASVSVPLEEKKNKPVENKIISQPIVNSTSSPVTASAVATKIEVKKEANVNVDEKVQDALDAFKDELKTNIKNSLMGRPEDHIMKNLQLTDADLSKIQVMANVGITNAAESLSMILNKRIELSIPDVSLLPVEKIPESFGEIDSVYLGVYMPLIGEVVGTILFSLREDTGFELVDSLFGTENAKSKELTEEGASALKEITNIIGASVINVIAEKTSMSIQPSVPTIVHDYMQSIVDSILVMHNISNDYALVMETEFYYENDKLIGNLLILPETESLKKIVSKLR